MKKILSMLLALALLLTLALPVLAEEEETLPVEGNPMKYVCVEKAKIYTEKDKKSEVLKEVHGGDKLLLEMMSKDKKWFGTLVENKKEDGQILGWILVEQLSETMPQSFCKHEEWSEWVVEQEPSCTSYGNRYRLCKICGIRDEDVTDPLPHNFTKWQVIKPATCTEKGERSRTCQTCGYEEKQEFLEEHDFSDWKILKEATCTEKGQRVHTCKVCGLEEKEDIEVLPHTYELKIITEATDHSAGTRRKVCKVCGFNGGEESFDPEGTLRRNDKGDAVKKLQQLLIDQGYLAAGGADGIFGSGTENAVMQFQKDHGLTQDGVAWPQTLKLLDHDFGPWTVLKEMTRTEPGLRQRVCKDCGLEQQESFWLPAAFERGDKSEAVRAFQQIITEAGYDAGTYDGIYGKKLDAAMAGFAAANGIAVQEGQVLPCQMDAVVNAWIGLAGDTWKGQGSEGGPVELVLTVCPSSQAEGEDGLALYDWTVTNLGTENVWFDALLLSFGDAPDFKQDDIVVVIDGIELMSNGGDYGFGTFSAGHNWGEGQLNFAAMAVSAETGEKWLSNVVTFENENAPAAKTVAPQAGEIDPDHLEDGIYAVAFDRGDILGGATGIYMNSVHFYTMDWFDIVDINTLAAGDTLVVRGEPILVTSVEVVDGTVMVNGGLEEGGVELRSEEDSNGFRVWEYDDVATYTERGVGTLTLAPSAVFIDSSDFEKGTITVGYDDIVSAIQNSENEYFNEENTTVRIEDGKVVEINRIYLP